jgi:hypothetical protein
VEERSDRRLNIIVRGIRESAKEDGLERKENDRKLAISVCVSTGAVEHNEMSESILEIRRLGKYAEEKLYRPLLVKIGRGNLREKLVRTGKKLRELNETNKTRYRIEADLAKEQTNSYQAMWKEADAQSGNGKKFYVTGPRENPILRSRYLTEEEAFVIGCVTAMNIRLRALLRKLRAQANAVASYANSMKGVTCVSSGS